MYEADDVGGANAVEMGLGGKDAPTRVKKQLKTINMPLEKRFKLEGEEKDVVQIKHPMPHCRFVGQDESQLPHLVRRPQH
jgi:hypothetical protein